MAKGKDLIHGFKGQKAAIVPEIKKTKSEMFPGPPISNKKRFKNTK